MKPIFITTSWDDGHILDIRLANLLKKYGIKGTFYIAPKNHEISKDQRLNEKQIIELGNDFEIGAHTLTHVRLPRASDQEAKIEINGSKEYLEKILGRKVSTFCYPCGDYLAKHIEMVKKAGFHYARTVVRHSFTSGLPFEAATTVHAYNHWSDLWKIALFARFNLLKTIKYFQWDVLAKAMFDHVLENGGIYHLWGHSWEIDKHNDWEKLESVLQYISQKNDIRYVTNGELAVLEQPKLLITIPYFPPYMGGTQLYAYNIAKRLQANFSWEVCVVTSGNRGLYTIEENYNGLKVFRLPYWFKISNTPINLFWPFLLKRIIKKENISLINAHAPVPVLSDITAIVAGQKPIILTYHTGTMRKHTILPNILIWLYEHVPLLFLLHRVNFIVCSSDFVRLGFLKKYQYKSKTITPAVDHNQFKPGNKKTDHPTILFVGGLTRSEQHKGLKILLKAFLILKDISPDLRLVVVGDGNMKSEYENYVRQLNLDNRISFTGKLSIDNLTLAYQQCDIFVLPSLAPAESFGMVIAEAMATGKPVIGSTAGGIPLVIDHEKTGLLVKSGDSEALAFAIKRLLDDPVLAKKLSEAGRKKALDQYNWDKQAAQYNDLFNDLYSGRNPISSL